MDMAALQAEVDYTIVSAREMRAIGLANLCSAACGAGSVSQPLLLYCSAYFVLYTLLLVLAFYILYSYYAPRLFTTGVLSYCAEFTLLVSLSN